jgi:hypothetical protein
MKKAKIVMTGIALVTAIVVLGFTACSDDPGGTPVDNRSGNANLSSVTINGVPATLGTSAGTFNGITNAGSVTLLSGASVSVTAKTAHARAAVNYDKYPFYNDTPFFWPEPPASFANTGEALAIRVTAENGTMQYYRINVTVASVALSNLTVGGTSVTLQPAATAWQEALAASVLFQYPASSQPVGGLEVVATVAGEGSTVKYGHATGTNTPTFNETSTISFLDGEYLYIEVSSADGENRAYYKVAVNFKQEGIIKYGSPIIKTDTDKFIDSLWNDATLQVYPIIKPYPNDCTQLFLANPDTWGEGRALWDEEGLYVYVRVYDPDVSATSGEGSTAHLVDSVELFVNEDVTFTGSGTQMYNNAGSQYRLGANGERSGEGGSPDAMIKLNRTSAWKTSEASDGFDGYIVIFQTPWRFRGKFYDSFVEGKKIGFELQINACTDAVRDGVMVWNNVAHTNYQNALDYGVATLEWPSTALNWPALPPAIVNQPLSVVCGIEEAVNLVVGATSPDGGALSYQWYQTASAAADGTPIGGATSESYSFTSSDTVGMYYYYVIISNTLNGQTAITKSAVARITVSDSEVILDQDEIFDFSASPLKNETPIAAQYQAVHKVDLGEFFDVKKYDKVSLEMKFYDSEEGEITTSPVGWSYFTLKWWDADNTGIVGDQYNVGQGQTDIITLDIPEGVLTEGGLRYLQFDSAGASQESSSNYLDLKYIEIIKIIFHIPE